MICFIKVKTIGGSAVAYSGKYPSTIDALLDALDTYGAECKISVNAKE